MTPACTPAARRGLVDQTDFVDERAALDIGILAWDYQLAINDISRNMAMRQTAGKVVSRLSGALGALGVVGEKWQFAVFESDSVNAFALPGGKIGIYEGIFTVANTEGRLATVIGHEMGHVIRKHTQAKLKANAVGIIAEKIADAAVSEKVRGKRSYQKDKANALKLLDVGFERPFSRQLETEADQFGVRLMRAAGYNPQEAIELWRAMMLEGTGESSEWKNTHPSHANRIKTIRDEMAATPS